jgi:hypothetical protein
MISHLMKTSTRILTIIAMLFLLHGCNSPESANAAPPNSSLAQGAGEPDSSPTGYGSTILIAVLVAAVTVVGTGLCTWFIAKSSLATDLKLLGKEADRSADSAKALTDKINVLLTEARSAEEEIRKLRQSADKLNTIRNNLKSSSVVRTYRQPVILVGPREVGKTSLLLQWHAPWNTSRLLDRTHSHYTSDVPVYDFMEEGREPHFADPEVFVPVHNHLVLRVHDFPGELDAQKSVCKAIITETENLQRETGKNLGIVLICMFNAEEASSGLSQATRQYYNGELFKELRSLVSHHQAAIERLILVFNKYDALKNNIPNVSDRELLQLCVEKFDPTYDLLHNVCNPGKVCEVFTMLSREEMHTKNRGAPIVLGEAAREFVRALAGQQAARDIVEQSATTYAAEKFYP